MSLHPVIIATKSHDWCHFNIYLYSVQINICEDLSDSTNRIFWNLNFDVRSECATLIKIIQERVVDPDSAGVIDGYIPLPISWKADKEPALGYSSFSPNVSSPSASPFPIHRHGYDSNAAADTVPTKTAASRGLFNHNDDNIESVSALCLYKV
jgi:hypothetical protein